MILWGIPWLALACLGLSAGLCLWVSIFGNQPSDEAGFLLFILYPKDVGATNSVWYLVLKPASFLFHWNISAARMIFVCLLFLMAARAGQVLAHWGQSKSRGWFVACVTAGVGLFYASGVATPSYNYLCLLGALVMVVACPVGEGIQTRGVRPWLFACGLFLMVAGRSPAGLLVSILAALWLARSGRFRLLGQVIGWVCLYIGIFLAFLCRPADLLLLVENSVLIEKALPIGHGLHTLGNYAGQLYALLKSFLLDRLWAVLLAGFAAWRFPKYRMACLAALAWFEMGRSFFSFWKFDGNFYTLGKTWFHLGLSLALPYLWLRPASLPRVGLVCLFCPLLFAMGSHTGLASVSIFFGVFYVAGCAVFIEGYPAVPAKKWIQATLGLACLCTLGAGLHHPINQTGLFEARRFVKLPVGHGLFFSEGNGAVHLPSLPMEIPPGLPQASVPPVGSWPILLSGGRPLVTPFWHNESSQIQVLARLVGKQQTPEWIFWCEPEGPSKKSLETIRTALRGVYHGQLLPEGKFQVEKLEGWKFSKITED